jgi:hypothetical protein
VIINLIEYGILHYRCRCGLLIVTRKPRYEINLLFECAILLLMGFEQEQLGGELFGYYRGLMEQTLAIKINAEEDNQTKLQATEVYEAMLARKELIKSLYHLEQVMVREFKSNG